MMLALALALLDAHCAAMRPRAGSVYVVWTQWHASGLQVCVWFRMTLTLSVMVDAPVIGDREFALDVLRLFADASRPDERGMP
jgi:hypothetical protein